MVSELTISVRQYAAVVQVSREMIQTPAVDIYAVLALQLYVSQTQGRTCWALTTRRRRCRRTWRVVVGERGYCRQHAKAHA